MLEKATKRFRAIVDRYYKNILQKSPPSADSPLEAQDLADLDGLLELGSLEYLSMLHPSLKKNTSAKQVDEFRARVRSDIFVIRRHSPQVVAQDGGGHSKRVDPFAGLDKVRIAEKVKQYMYTAYCLDKNALMPEIFAEATKLAFEDRKVEVALSFIEDTWYAILNTYDKSKLNAIDWDFPRGKPRQFRKAKKALELMAMRGEVKLQQGSQ